MACPGFGRHSRRSRPLALLGVYFGRHRAGAAGISPLPRVGQPSSPLPIVAALFHVNRPRALACARGLEGDRLRAAADVAASLFHVNPWVGCPALHLGVDDEGRRPSSCRRSRGFPAAPHDSPSISRRHRRAFWTHRVTKGLVGGMRSEVSRTVGHFLSMHHSRGMIGALHTTRLHGPRALARACDVPIEAKAARLLAARGRSEHGDVAPRHRGPAAATTDAGALR
jgi:hypothetical protein